MCPIKYDALFKILTRGLLIASLAGTATLGAASAAAPAGRPNILFCIADDWAWPHAGAYGDNVVRTPNFDRVAREGMLFANAFTAAPSCTPSRGGILTGQWVHRLAEGGNLNGTLPKRFPVYPDLLEAAGYFVGLHGKGWAPGNHRAGGWNRNPAGPTFEDFSTFLQKRPKGRPFCFWYGSTNPHRGYDVGSGVRAGMKIEDVIVPPYLPDTPVVRSDILDYYIEVQQFDQEVGRHLETLAASGEAENTIVVITGDNGWPFPHGKTNLYDAGSRQPLCLRWPARVKGGRVEPTLVSLTDLAPTFLEVAAVSRPSEMTGRSLLPLLDGKPLPGPNRVLLERERHAAVRRDDVGYPSGGLSYPSRGLRTPDFLYIRNFRPERWPEGDPELYMQVGPYGDIDNGPSKTELIKRTGDPLFALNLGKRPAEELYDLGKDPHQIRNVAGQPGYAAVQKRLREELNRWLHETGDPRVAGNDDRWDRYEYFYPPGRIPPGLKKN